MTRTVYRYTFGPGLPADEVESTLLLAVVSAESLRGESEVRLDAGHAFDAARRTCVIDAGTPAGFDLCRLFTGFLRREFGDDSFRVERAERPARAREPAAAATA